MVSNKQETQTLEIKILSEALKLLILDIKVGNSGHFLQIVLKNISIVIIRKTWE